MRDGVRGKSGAGALIAAVMAGALALAAAGAAVAQTDPSGQLSANPLEKWLIHWVGPITISTQKLATDEYYASHTRDLVMPFGPVAAGPCHMPRGVLVIRRDGTGEFRATTSTTDVTHDAWHTDIELLDAKGRRLFDTGDFVGAEMSGGEPGTPYLWVNKFTMDRATLLKVYDNIDHASLSYVC